MTPVRRHIRLLEEVGAAPRLADLGSAEAPDLTTSS